MTHTKTLKSKIFTLLCSFTICLALMLGIAFAGEIVARADDGEKVTIENVEVSFNKTKIGDKLVSMFNFVDETKKTLVVHENANYTARIDVIYAYGHTCCLWKEAPGYLWSTIENSEITRDTPYVVRVTFEPKTGYVFDASKEAEYLSTMNIPGFEIGKGKDIEVWTTNLGEYYFYVDFVVTKGMNHMFGWPLNAYPEIGVPYSNSLCTAYTDTAFWLVGAPAPYTFEKKIAPVGTIVETQKSEILNTYVCNYQITAVNAMNGGMMYITATAADGQTCDIPIWVQSVSGGHEHTWVEEIEPIGNDHHGYTKCTAEDCPGVAYQFDKGSRYSTHDYAYGCNVKCGTCGHVNPEGKHTYIWQFDVEDTEYHISKCRCGEVKKDENGNPVKEKHHGEKSTCFAGAECEVCGATYQEKIEHAYAVATKYFTEGEGHFSYCVYCGEEDTTRRHMATGGTATCNRRAVCTHTENGVECGHEYGDYLNHTFANGKCTECGADEFITKLDIEVPYWTVGTPYKALEFPIIKEGRVYCWQTTNYNSYQKSGNGMANVTELTSNIVLVYKFFAQANCKLPANAQDVQITVKNGELVSQSISDSTLVVCVLLRFDNTVQSIDLDFAQPYIENPTADLNITEKNGMKITVDWENVSLQNRFNTNQPYATVTVTAPEGKRFPEFAYPWSEWLCDINITGGELLQWVSGTLNADKTEIRFVVIVSTPLPCPHLNVVLTDQGQPETCTVPGLKEQYDCKGCAKKFVDVECTMPWTIENAIIPAGHKCNRIEHTDVAPGKDGNIEYYKCQREECGKLFADAACSSEITLAQTVIHDFKTEWSADKEAHFHECKNCDITKDKAAHRPDRTEATEDDPVKCLDCGYVIEPALAHTTHHTALVPGEDATCIKEGKKPYYKCDGCEVKFEDEAATKPIADESTLVIPKAHGFGAWVDEIPATEETEGVKGHKDCTFCGKHFDENGAEIADLTIAKLVKAEVTVVGGTGGGRLTVGEMVTITANDPAEGKVFKCWKDANGNVVSTKRSYTFMVTGETTLTTVYEDAPKKKGLSGGAIAGIIVGSVVVVGISGFAIFWFAIKKKTFVELADASKKIFTKKKQKES